MKLSKIASVERGRDAQSEAAHLTSGPRTSSRSVEAPDGNFDGPRAEHERSETSSGTRRDPDRIADEAPGGREAAEQLQVLAARSTASRRAPPRRPRAGQNSTLDPHRTGSRWAWSRIWSSKLQHRRPCATGWRRARAKTPSRSPLEQQLRHADDAPFIGDAELVAHVGEELRLIAHRLSAAIVRPQLLGLGVQLLGALLDATLDGPVRELWSRPAASRRSRPARCAYVGTRRGTSLEQPAHARRFSRARPTTPYTDCGQHGAPNRGPGSPRGWPGRGRSSRGRSASSASDPKMGSASPMRPPEGGSAGHRHLSGRDCAYPSSGSEHRERDRQRHDGRPEQRRCVHVQMRAARRRTHARGDTTSASTIANSHSIASSCGGAGRSRMDARAVLGEQDVPCAPRSARDRRRPSRGNPCGAVPSEHPKTGEFAVRLSRPAGASSPRTAAIDTWRRTCPLVRTRRRDTAREAQLAPPAS